MRIDGLSAACRATDCTVADVAAKLHAVESDGVDHAVGARLRHAHRVTER